VNVVAVAAKAGREFALLVGDPRGYVDKRQYHAGRKADNVAASRSLFRGASRLAAGWPGVGTVGPDVGSLRILRRGGAGTQGTNLRGREE
jgi:hypothetical protein